MIIFFPAGQLGNQIFQYSFLEKIKVSNELIITSRCEYFNVFEISNIRMLFLNKYIRYFFRRLCKVFVKIGLFGHVSQARCIEGANYEVYDCKIIEKKGLLNIKLVEGFFQSEQLISQNFKAKIKISHLEKAREFLNLLPNNVTPIAIHIRRGDYLDWNVLGNIDPSLPLSFYKEAMSNILVMVENPFFVFFSNDPEFVEKNFSNLPNKIVSKNSVAVDFAAMTMCNSGIISNSTLAWWAAKYMAPGSVIYAPEYWLGWKKDIWYPRGIESKNFNYLRV